MTRPRILVMAGSARRDSLARRLTQACIGPLEAAGGELDVVAPADYPTELYNGDLEAESGLPASVVALQHRFAAARGLLLVTPEYNGSVTPLVKNTLDWCSRPNPEDAERSGGAIFAGKPAALLASSPGPMGGMRALFHMRDVLGYLGMLVIAQQLAVGRTGDAIGADGRLVDARQQSGLEGVLGALVDTTQRLS